MSSEKKEIKRKITYARLVELFHICLKEVETMGIKYGNIKEPITINSRMSRAWGRCHTFTNPKTGEVYSTIEISENLLIADEKIIKSTIIHEILHTCEDCQNHGQTWLKYACIMNETYGYNIKARASSAEKGIEREDLATSKYCIECLNCNKKIYRSKISSVIKNPEQYRCKCGGKFKRIK